MRNFEIDGDYNELKFEVSGAVEGSMDDIIYEMMIEYQVDKINMSEEQIAKSEKLQAELTNLIMDVIQNK